MSPEQIRGLPLDERSDIYCLGVTFFEMLTGRPPFEANTIMGTLKKVLEEDPIPPRKLNPKIHRDVETICLKCLEKEPSRRYQTAQELSEELARFLTDEPIHARPVTRAERAWRWCRRKPALASFIAATSLLLLAILVGSPIAI